MASWMINSAFRCITVPIARPWFRMEGPGGFAHSGATVDGQRVPIFREASVYNRRR